MSKGIVDSETIEYSQLLVPKADIFKPYVWPFLIIYPAYNYVFNNYYDVYFMGREWTFIYTLLLVSIHALIWLLPRWNLDMKVKFQYTTVNDLKSSTHILMKAKPSCGLSEICNIEKSPVQVAFKYQKRKFLYNPKTETFSPPKFFVDDEELIIENLKAIRGLSSEKIPIIERHYGPNTFDIPVPTFLELFVEHMLAPFFVFQLFSISLWLMDEMWYLSIFSLVMLLSFEATTVYQRKSTMTEFQSMGIKPYDIYVYRDKKWSQIKTSELLPGDITSIVRTPHEDLSIPCDMIILQGSCIVNEAMLSGESTPLLKESIQNRENDAKFQPDGIDKNSLLHGGTSCLQVTVPEKPIIPLAPDNGALAIVAKTGFETTQGSLVRVMIFSSERMSVANKEAFFFILFLLVFAIIAARYVWVEGTKMGRKQSKLILDCIIVLTSVVPPELPMELTMAVNQSLAALAKHYIYCTEPFRIPVAGRIDVCCFDKTGTLTAEDLFFEGLAGFNKEDTTVLSKCDSAEVPDVTIELLGSVHALVRLDDGDVVGDPMEKETVKASGWKLDEKVKNVMIGPSNKKIKILKRFQFSSSLKRSSVISKVGEKVLVGVKGAPETIADRLTDIPSDYEQTYKYFTRNGSRVLALAYKYLPNEKNLDKIERKEVESDLLFAGFIVFHCPMKEDAIDTIQMLNQSSHRCVMITGDNPLTACHVAAKVGIITKDVLILDKPEKNHAGDSSLEWRDVEETRIIPVNKDITFDMKFLRENDLCITGYALNELIDHPQISTLIRHSWIYSRVSPSQKEYILNTYKNLGYNTLMCGDGTNDVGALKQANIGIALLNGTEESLKKMQENKKIENFERMYQKQCDLMKKWNQPPPKVPVHIAHLYPPGPYNPHYLKALEQHGTEITDEIRQKVAEANKINLPAGELSQVDPKEPTVTDSLLASLQESQEDEEAPVLKLGDASVAAPFTSKLSNVSTVVNVIRQGRCALVSTIQMYKILALNCLISAYSLSVLYLAGIKFGDAQATVSGILLSVCFMSISRGKSIEKLSKERPQPGIFNIYIMGSILGQFAIHLVALIYITKEIYILEPREPQVDLDKTFEPSLLNTAMFLIQLSQQISTFTVNYIGRPFRESIHENKGMYYGILGVAFLCISGSTEFIAELNEAMQFVPMTTLFKFKLTTTMLLDFALAWIIEIVLKYFFMDFKAADIADRTLDDDSAFIKSEEEKKTQ